MAKKGPSDSTLVVMLAQEQKLKLFHSPDRTPYAILPVEDHTEVWRLNSSDVETWLSNLFFDKHQRVPAARAMEAALGVLRGRAIRDCPEHIVWLRVAQDKGNVYLDMGDRKWRVLLLKKGTWDWCKKSPVFFRRAAGMLAYPEPQMGGNVATLWRYVNLSDSAQQLVMLAWITYCYRTGGAIPIALLTAQSGTGKTFSVECVRSLIDPSCAPHCSRPANSRDLAISAENSWLLIYDNLSYIDQWFSDDLCRLATGSSLRIRKNYSDRDEELFTAWRPAMITSIIDVGKEHDFLQRCLHFLLAPIEEDKRKPLAVLKKCFVEDAPLVFGALLDLTAEAMAMEPEGSPNQLPRMADFALWGIRIERVLGLPEGSFMAAYRDNLEVGERLVRENNSVGPALMYFIKSFGAFEGTVSQLLTRLNTEWRDDQKGKDWPKTEALLGKLLKKLQPSLRALGITVQFGHNGHDRWITIRQDAVKMPSVPSVPSEYDPLNIPEDFKVPR